MVRGREEAHVVLHRASIAIAAALGLACARAPDPAPVVVYDGATTIADRVLADAAPLLRARAGATLRVLRHGSGKGVQAALAGEVDVAGVSRGLTAEELARRPYFQIIGYDALAAYVHASSPVRALTRAQLRDLFTGRARTWRAVGGPALPVVACTEHLDSGRATLEAFQALVLDGAAYGPVHELEDPSDCVAWLAATPGGVAIATAALARPGVRAVTVDGRDPTPQNVRAGTYPITRPLLLVSRAAPTGAVRALFDVVLSPEGQRIVERNGLVPAR
jgi:phosphate transport system substrate-binding protein